MNYAGVNIYRWTVDLPVRPSGKGKEVQDQAIPDIKGESLKFDYLLFLRKSLPFVPLFK